MKDDATEFEYAFAEQHFATGCDPLAVCICGSMHVVGALLFNPTLNADEDDLPQEEKP